MFLIQKKGSLFFFTVLILLLCIIMPNGLTVYAASNDIECADIYSDQPTNLTVKKKRIVYVCPDCQTTFTRENYLNRHNCPNRKEEKKKNLYECSECNACFMEKRSLIRHAVIHQPKMPFKCNICNQSFKADFYLNRHLKQHLQKKIFTCNVCNKSFKEKVELILHQTTEHQQTTEAVFKCTHDNCHKVYLYKTHLDNHIKNKHKLEISQIEEPPCEYSCDLCNATYKNKISLTRHKKFKHLPCGKEFVNLTNLRLHQKNCTICQKTIEKLQPSLMVSIQISILPRGLTSSTGILQPNGNELTATDEQSVHDNCANTIYQRTVSQENNISDPCLNHPNINNSVSIFLEKCAEIIFDIKVNLLATKDNISKDDDSTARINLTSVTENIIQLNQLIPLFQSIDSEITKNNNTANIEIISDTLRDDALISLSNHNNAEDLISIHQQVNKVFTCLLEIFEDWQLNLLQTRNINSSGNENINLSEDENINPFVDENTSFLEDKNIISLHTDTYFSLDNYFIMLPDNPMLQ
ncbi:MAG: C2H2-type zinc finger protein [Endozoicomonadaceae bacterium]|nr:C2H2-type zinc finger protein [Endozoicomonadaceae bacterium]